MFSHRRSSPGQYPWNATRKKKGTEKQTQATWVKRTHHKTTKIPSLNKRMGLLLNLKGARTNKDRRGRMERSHDAKTETPRPTKQHLNTENIHSLNFNGRRRGGEERGLKLKPRVPYGHIALSVRVRKRSFQKKKGLENSKDHCESTPEESLHALSISLRNNDGYPFTKKLGKGT